MKRVYVFAVLMTAPVLRVGARELRIPNNMEYTRAGYVHTQRTLEQEQSEDHTWDYDVWTSGYNQSADKSFNSCHGTEKGNLAQLFYGKEHFRGRDAFAENTFTATSVASTDAASVWLRFATLTPKVEYDEKGIVAGVQITHRGRDDRAQVGFRARLAYRLIEMHRDDCCDLGEEKLQDVCKQQSDLFPANTDPLVTQDSTIEPDWAYRLDFISELCSSSCGEDFVKYASPVKIGTVDVTQGGPLAPAPGAPTGNSVHLIQVAVGGTPIGVLGAVWNTTISTAPFLDGAGAGPGDGNRARFSNAVAYAALAADIDAQSKFWLVPTIVEDGAVAIPPGKLVESTGARSIRLIIEALVKLLDTSSAHFFEDQGISFDTQKTRGIGDLETELFAGYNLRDSLYLEGQFGMRWPTAKKASDSNLIYSQIARGNNGHIEIKAGAMGWWELYDWLVFQTDASYHHAFNATERVGAAFKGATVKNLGPAVDANINWDYVLFHFDTNFMHPDNPGLGFVVGYELYWKGCDKVCFVNSKKCQVVLKSDSDGITAKDFFGTRQTLDPAVLAKDTERIAHKIRLEFFHHWNFGDLYAGWSQVVAGKNSMQETAWHLGMDILF